MTVAGESGVSAMRWRCTTSSRIRVPASLSSPSAPASNCQRRARRGSRSMTEPMVIAWSSCSTTQADTSASCSIRKTCSGEDVG